MAEVMLEVTPRDLKKRLDAGDALSLIDVREPSEFQLARIERAELIPMGTIPARLQEIEKLADDTTLVVFCHHGVRSLQVVSWLRAQGVNACQSMAGGIDRWSVEVYTNVPRY